MKPLLLTCASLLCLATYAGGSNILMAMTLASKSHKNLFWPLSVELANRGHHVTILSPFPKTVDHPRIEEVVPKDLQNYITELLAESMFTIREEKGPLLHFLQVIQMTIEHCEVLLNSAEGAALLEKPFDLVIIDELGSDCGFVYAYKHKAATIFYATPGYFPPAGIALGNPFPTSVSPYIILPFSDTMNFWERILNTLVPSFFNAVRYYYMLPRLDAVLREKVPDMPPIVEYEKNVSLVLVNQHFSMEYPRPYLPSFVEIGGVHCEEPKKLPKDLLDFIEGSGDHGVIYFSFGSVVKGKDMPEHIRQAFITAFAKLRQRVIWKWEAEPFAGLPKNVIQRKWLPQQDILAHPKVRVFITHGGLLSQQEAVCHGVPLLSIPFFGDQDTNAARAKKSGYGLAIDSSEITAERLLKELNSLLDDPRYTHTIRKMSRAFKDQPQKPLERAAFWTEYVLRHQGAPQLKTPARNMPFYQYYLLDVFAFLGLVLLLFFLVIFKIVSVVVRLCCGKSKKTKRE